MSDNSFIFMIISGGVLTFVGIIGNSLVLFILTRKKFRSISMFRYYSFVTVFETLQIPIIWIYIFSDFILINKYEIVCKLTQYFSNLFGVFLSWMSAIISIDRYIGVKYSTKYLFRNNFGFQFTIIACLLLVSSMVSVPYYYFDNIYSLGNVTQCNYAEDPWIGIKLDIVLLVAYLLSPFSISVTFSCLTAYQLIQKKKILHVKNFNKEKRYLKVLISMDLFYLICYLQWCVYTILNDVFSIQNYYPSFMAILYSISIFLFYVYQSFSFFVYFLSNKQFRSFFLKAKH